MSTKTVDIAEIAKELSFGDRVQLASGSLLSDVHFRIGSGSLMLDLALGTGCVGCSRGLKRTKQGLVPAPSSEWKHPECRGWPGGRVCEVFGDYSSGKSTLLGQALIEAQRMGGVSVVVDAEKTLSKGRLIQMGANPDQLLVLQPDYLEQADEMLVGVLEKLPDDRKGPPVCVGFDTISCLLMRAEIEEEGAGPSMMARPKYVRKMLGELNTLVSRRNVLLLIANQTQEIPTRHGSRSETNIGGGLRFFASVRVETWTSNTGFDEGGFYEGIATRIKTVKNKDNRAHAELSVPIYSETTVDGFPPGVDSWMGVLSFLSDKEYGIGIVRNSSGWWSCPAFAEATKIEMKNTRIRNRGELAAWLKQYDGLAEFLVKKVFEHKRLMWRV